MHNREPAKSMSDENDDKADLFLLALADKWEKKAKGWEDCDYGSMMSSAVVYGYAAIYRECANDIRTSRKYPVFFVEWAIKPIHPLKRKWNQEKKCYLSIEDAQEKVDYIQSQPRTETFPECIARIFTIRKEILDS